MFEQVEQTGRSIHAPEEFDRIEQLADALVGSNYTINKKEITEEGLIDHNKILDIRPTTCKTTGSKQASRPERMLA